MELLIIEMAKLGLQIYMTNLKMVGKSDEEIDQIFREEKAKFDQNRPEDLPDV